MTTLMMAPKQQRTSVSTSSSAVPYMRGEEAVLLGRRGVVGTVNATSLAALVRALKSPSHRNYSGQTYWLKCCEKGLEIHGPKYDEGFESDDADSTRSDGAEAEDRNGGGSGDTSSGVSDLDDGVAVTSSKMPTAELIKLSPLRESYAISDIVFCHIDPMFPNILVWVVNNNRNNQHQQQRKPLTTNLHGNSLETLVFDCKNESSVRQLCMNYQELSRKYKLDVFNKNRRNNRQPQTAAQAPRHLSLTTYTSSEPEVKSSFIKELEGVIENHYDGQLPFPLGRASRRDRNSVIRQRQPPSLLIFPPACDAELHKKWTPPTATKEVEEPPKRPERRRYVRKKGLPAQDDSNVLRGTFIRVNVDPMQPVSVPQVTAGTQLMLKPQYTWMYGVPTSTEMVLANSGGQRTSTGVQLRSRRNCRSVSPTMSRRISRPPPMQHRYGPDVHYISATKLVVHGHAPRDFISPGNMIYGGNTLKSNKKSNLSEQTRYTTLKPVIKKSNNSPVNNRNQETNQRNKFHSTAGESNTAEPKKVTFSAYATVQVLD